MANYSKKSNTVSTNYLPQKRKLIVHLGKDTLIFNKSEVLSIIHALKSKNFAILTGISGTGKTQLARALANYIASKSFKVLIEEVESGKPLKVEEIERGRVAFTPVRPDWNESKKVFGFYNPLTGLFYPSDALRVLLNAYRDFRERGEKEAGKYFIILDEMNLARVEYYFSDILSCMESPCVELEGERQRIGETFQLHFLDGCAISRGKSKEYEKEQYKEILCTDIGTQEECPYSELHGKKGLDNLEKKKYDDKVEKIIGQYFPIPARIPFPPNLTIIGTVNVDETTFSFAPKVLDRAFVMEFKDVDYETYIGRVYEKYQILSKDGKIDKFDFLNDFLKKLKKILEPASLHFGYRVVKEMLDYLKNVEVKDFNTPLDFLIKSKVLPKLRGTEEQIGKELINLLAFCFETNYEGKVDETEKIVSEVKTFDELCEKKGAPCFPTSAEKVFEMLKNAKAIGFASFF